MLGVIQEQHAERCRLFAQWHRLDWPILHDPINKLGLRGIPMIVEVDEEGVTASVSPTVEALLASLASAKGSNSLEDPQVPVTKPDLAAIRQAAKTSNSYEEWRNLGDALMLWGGGARVSRAIDAYEQARQLESEQAEIDFRLGVAHRMRHDTSTGTSVNPRPRKAPFGRAAHLDLPAPAAGPRSDNDFQLAVAHWGEALQRSPNQYIYRRRIQQYGPRLIKPYSFYDWVEQARKDIAARGETPVQLLVEPSGAELALPTKRFATAEDGDRKSPDPRGRINRDIEGLVRSQTVVVPAVIQPGQTVRVHIALQPGRQAHWNNESEPTMLWLELPRRWKADRNGFASALPSSAESSERRLFEFEVKPAASQTKATTLKAYALYYVCETSGGACLYLRQDIEIPINIATH